MVLSTLDLISGEGAGRNGNIATLLVTLDMFKETAAGKDLADGFVNYARGIEGVEVGVLFRECPSGEYKISLRSKGYADVARVAEIFGGGGHSHAAGCTVEGDLDTVKTRVIKAIKEEMTAAEKA
jgi:phosphoesterase RecJ-like protein